MASETNPKQVAQDVVVTMEYILTVDGEIVDSTRETEPIVYLHGYGNILPALENALLGMKPGQSKQIHIKSVDGYGELDPEAFADVPRDEIPADIVLEPGAEVQVSDEDGEELDAIVTEVDEEWVRLDFNHPLAGKDLDFEIHILELREALPEELEHGHVHTDDDEDGDYDEEEDEDDED